ncbi:hypothetical protein F2P81_021199 [Scophthalmus maximus]|uniref:Uncharacterized protein n=1 Tax=Scophthalmus maximus TaxID=52904 RepID=A0A6A4S563_SCOMX|nr:hypothetical protein F2P81_021199 [Scophthalmus maximus]
MMVTDEREEGLESGDTDPDSLVTVGTGRKLFVYRMRRKHFGDKAGGRRTEDRGGACAPEEPPGSRRSPGGRADHSPLRRSALGFRKDTLASGDGRSHQQRKESGSVSPHHRIPQEKCGSGRGAHAKCRREERKGIAVVLTSVRVPIPLRPVVLMLRRCLRSDILQHRCPTEGGGGSVMMRV